MSLYLLINLGRNWSESTSGASDFNHCFCFDLNADLTVTSFVPFFCRRTLKPNAKKFKSSLISVFFFEYRQMYYKTGFNELHGIPTSENRSRPIHFGYSSIIVSPSLSTQYCKARFDAHVILVVLRFTIFERGVSILD